MAIRTLRRLGVHKGPPAPRTVPAVPKIAAPTLAEHRRQRLDTILEAAREIVLDEGVEGLTFTAVAARAGLARNSLYEYFDTREALLLAVLEAELPAWVTAIEKAMAAARTPDGVVKAYITAQLARVAEGDHQWASLVRSVRFDGPSQARLAALHQALTEPLAAALKRLGQPRPHVTAMLLHGIVSAATSLVVEGQPVGVVTRDAVRLALEGVGSKT
jgi:AcrR family transcriptional regulator